MDSAKDEFMGRGAHSFSWRTPWGVLIFMIAFAILIALVSKMYLIPALEAAKDATPHQKQLLAAWARLLLAIVLFIIGAGIVITFRVSRFLFPRGHRPKPTQTQYIDAWAESAKRMDSPRDPNSN
jgi:Mn2+/Fe2+ NRAMP family transporter